MDGFIFDDGWAPFEVPDEEPDFCATETFFKADPERWATEDMQDHHDWPLTPEPTASRLAMQRGLRDAALFREGELEQRAMVRQWEANGGSFPLLLPPMPVGLPALEETYPNYALARAHGARVRMDGRPAGPLIAKSKRMRRDHGRLVFMRLLHPELDAYSMVSAEGRCTVVSGSKAAIYSWASVHAKAAKALTCVLQRDEYGRTHSHFALPLAALSKRLQQDLWAAPHGRDGGLCLTPEMHGVVIGDSDDDLEAVACYMSKYPDERSKLPQDDPGWLALADEIAENTQYGEGRKVSLTWDLPSRWRPGMKPM